jgi:rod shape determining protein RodA
MTSIAAVRRRSSLAGSPAGRLRADPTAAWRHLDLVLVGCLVAISAIGVLMVYSATRGPGGGEPIDQTYLKRQLMFVAIGFVILIVTAAIDYHRVRDFAPMAYLACVGMLALVVSGLGSSRKGTQAWFDLGSFQLQPSEPTKLALIVTLAAVIAHFREDIDLRRLGVLLAIAAVPLGLIMLQPDLGTALVLVSITAGILVVGGANGRHLLVLLVLGVLATGVVLNSDMLEEYQRDRLTTFLDQGGDTVGSDQEERYNLDQSKIAIGAGGMLGQGLFEGLQTRLDNVPEQHTDFIFTAVGEELGFVGAGTLLALFAIVAWRIWRTAQLARDDLGTLICVGVLCMLLFQIFENIGMTMGIMPITGIPLPFVSYGGSSTLASFAAIGLVLNVHARRFS